MSESRFQDKNKQDMHLGLIRCVIKDLESREGSEAIEALARLGQIDPKRLRAGKGWVSFAQMNDIAEAALQAYGGNEQHFADVCAGNLKSSYGPLRYLLFASTPRYIFQKAVDTMHFISRISSWKVLRLGNSFAHAKYFSEKNEGRALCLIRQANIRSLPTLWNLPQAQVEERRCIAWGDETCEYVVRWAVPWRWQRIVLASALGLLLSFVFSHFFASAQISAVWLASALGLVAGIIWELGHQQVVHREYREGTDRSLQQLSEDEAAAYRENEALREREAYWQNQMEQELAEHQHAIQNMRDQLYRLRHDQVVDLRSYTHDIRNPLTGFQMLIDLIQQDRTLLSEDGRWALDEQHKALQRIYAMLDELMQTTEQSTQAQQAQLAIIDVHKLRETYARRLRAFARRGEVHSSVISDRDMPDSIYSDPMRVERVLDNIVSNAAKYTKRGHILVNFSGRAGFLQVKVLDTGIGISPDRIHKIFTSTPTPSGQKDIQSYGLGLSVTVRVLDELGGQLEVLSKPGEGTRFMLFFPLRINSLRQARPNETEQERIDRVVKIRML